MAVLIVLALVVLITFCQVFRHGLFNALIMAGLSLVSALAAFNYYEVLAVQLNRLGAARFGSESLSLVALFLVVLILLRLVVDRLIPANVEFPMVLDRAGATLFGLVSALVMVGVLVTSVAMLPVGPTLLGFDRYPEMKLEQGKLLFPNPDGFVQGLVARASRHGFAGRARFSHYHPNMQRELYMRRQVLVEGSRRESSRDAMAVTAAWLPEDGIRTYRGNEVVSAASGERLLAVRLELKGGSEKEPGAADADGKIRMALAQVRLVGFDAESPESAAVRYPLGVLKPGWRVLDSMDLRSGKMFMSPRAEVDLLFSWPESLTKFVPQYVEFKGSSRGALSAGRLLSASGPPVNAQYAAARKSSMVALEAPEVGGGELEYTVLAMSPPGRSPTGDMEPGLPTLGALEESRSGKTQIKEKDLKAYREVEALQERAGRWSRVHLVAVMGSQYMAGMDRGAKPTFFVPQDYSLTCVKLQSQRGASMPSRLSEQVALVDVHGREHRPVGYVMSLSGPGGIWSEIAYTADTGRIERSGFNGYPEKSSAPAGSTIREGVLLFLIPQTEGPLGVIGMRVRQGARDAGAMYTLGGGVDVVLPAGQE